MNFEDCETVRDILNFVNELGNSASLTIDGREAGIEDYKELMAEAADAIAEKLGIELA